MAVRNTPKLTEILKKFEEARQKTAEDLPETPEGIVLENHADITDSMRVPTTQTPAVDSVPSASTAGEVAAAAKEVEDASKQVVDAKETLKAVTDEFINEHTAALKKEAQIFGELFAASCIDRMNKTAAIQKAGQDAYLATMGAFNNAYAEEELMNKTAAIYDEAYFTTLAKYAGLESVEDLKAALTETPENLPPEVINAALAASGIDPMTIRGIDAEDSDEEDGDSDEESDELEEDSDAENEDSDEEDEDSEEETSKSSVSDALAEAANAASSNAEAIKSIAEAADALAAEGEYEEDDNDTIEDVDTEALDPTEALGIPAEAPIADGYVDQDGNVDLPKIASQAYNNVIAYLANGVC